MAADPRFELVSTADPTALEAFVDPLLDLEPKFYSSICDTRADARRLVVGALGMPASDLGRPEVLIVDHEPAGLLIRFPSAELMFRQLATLKLATSLFGPLSEDRRAFIQAWGRGVPPVSKGGIYISKFVVSGPLRGSGIGSKLLRLATESAPPGTTEVVLHVRRENLGARAFYERHGFQVVDQGITHDLMRRRTGD